MSTSTFTVKHIRVETAKTSHEVTKNLERGLGRFDPAVLRLPPSTGERVADARSRIEAMAGPSGFMLFGTTDHGELLTLFGVPTKAVQYVIGNPLLAFEMTRHHVAAGLYAPLRVLIYEKDGMTVLEYDRPSTLFGQFNDAEVDAVASVLDEKLEALVAAATA
jgi:uncharacterized protein (DUF302 family)